MAKKKAATKKTTTLKKAAKKKTPKTAVRKKASGKKAVKKKSTKKKASKEASGKKAAKKKTSKKAAVKKAAKGNAVRRFELVDGSSSKFWEISQNGSEFTVRYGRIGTDGQAPKTKDMGTSEKAAAEVEKLIRAKAGKGYAETANIAGTTSVSEKASRKKAVKKKSTKKTASEKKAAATNTQTTPVSLGSSLTTETNKQVLGAQHGWLRVHSTPMISIKRGYDWPVEHVDDGEAWWCWHCSGECSVCGRVDHYIPFTLNTLIGKCDRCESVLTLDEKGSQHVNEFYRLVGESRVLTTDLLKVHIRYSENPAELNLDQYERVPVDVCRRLKKGRFQLLSLNGIKSLSDEEAKMLSECCCDMALDGIVDISVKALRAIVGTKRKWFLRLSLGGITHIDMEAALILAKRTNLHIALNGITSLSADIAAVLAVQKGTCPELSLNGLKVLDDDVADALGRANPLNRAQGGVRLNGLAILSDAAAESLSKREGDLNLEGLTSLSDAAAESLSKSDGNLSLSGLTSLSDAAAESLSQCQGRIDLDLGSLPESAADILRKHPSFADED